MRIKNRVKLAVLVAGLSCFPVRGARAQGSPSQMMKLPPVPDRGTDPDLRFHRDPAALLAAQRAAAVQNEKRRQLVLWAANELVVLSERAEKAASGPDGDSSKAELAANVNKIEALAKNLAAAMKAQ